MLVKLLTVYIYKYYLLKLPHHNKLPPHSYIILPLWTNYPLTLTPFYPLGSPTLTSFYPLWTNYPLTLTPFYPPGQPNSYLILPPLDKLPTHSYTILPPWQPNSYITLPPLNKLPPHSYTIHFTPWAAQLLPHFIPSGQITPSLVHNFTPLAA